MASATGMSRRPTLDIAIRKVAPQTPRRWPTRSARVHTRVERDEPVGRLIALVVDAHARGLGVGRALVAHVEERARPEGCVQLDLSSSDRREDAHAFYRRLGFDDASRRFVKDLTPDEASGPSTPR
jgi:GNAT superfamily N-acetyltransferase